MTLLTVHAYTSDIENTSAMEIKEALNKRGIPVRSVCVRPMADMPERPHLVTADGHIYQHNANCCRQCEES